MKNSIQTLIREAFNTAYKIHKNKSLNENSDTIGAKLNQSERAIADEKLNILVNKLPGYKTIKWDPSAQSGLSQKQQNYLIEKLVELYKSTRDEKYKNALAQIYQYSGTFRTTNTGEQIRDESPLWKVARKKYIDNSALDRLEKQKPGTLYDFLAKSWTDTFGGGKFVGGSNAGEDIFDALVNDYKFTGPGFGAYLASRLVNRVSNEIQNATTANSEFGAGVVSLDKPLDATGKTGEYGEEDSAIGDDEDFSVDMNDDTEELDPTSHLAGAEGEDEVEDNGEPEYVDKEEKRKKSSMLTIQLFIKIVNDAIRAAKSEGIYNKQPLFFDMLGWMVNDFMSYDEMNSKYPDRFLDKNGKPFSPASYFSSVIRGDLGKAPSFVDTILDQKWPLNKGISPDIFKFEPANFFKAAKVAQGAGLLEEEEELQKFLSENLDKVMEKVYNRLLKNLNG